MIELKEMTLESFLYNIQSKLTHKETKQLISWTSKINPVDLLTVFESANKSNLDRIFWTNSSNDFALVGVGSVHKLISEQQSFDQLENEWKTILQQAIIHDPFQQSGTGLVAMGGMSFDPKRNKSKLWEKYPTSQMTVPQYVVVQNREDYFFTVNYLIQGNMNTEQLVADSNKMQNLLLHSSTKPYNEKLSIVSKKEIEPDRWKQSVQEAVEEIRKDQAKKIVLAREMRIILNEPAVISELLKKLKETQPNSYIFAFEHGDNCFLGATPERLVQVEGENVLSTCLAGTAPRGKTVTEDERIADALLKDQKNREEHEYVVQMIKRSMEQYCEDIYIPNEPVVLSLRNLQHLYTPVRATLKKESTVFDIVKELHPTPALGGVPTEKALAFIREKELMDRGWYGAPIGWLDSEGNSEFAVAIRSGLIQGKEVSLFAGCGVMKDSDPTMEYEETNVKFLPMLTILEDTDESY
ncbi:isochorismate synthase [Pseudogracilibacillus sp. SE30717A]|uniref:isochorismate synthase n=1 Tax=Pseudogracilibacillus sp. SE30717A TaxID=3098293 RepID=UPI00300DF1D5